MMGSCQTRLFEGNSAACLFDFANFEGFPALPSVRPTVGPGPAPLGPGLGPGLLGPSLGPWPLGLGLGPGPLGPGLGPKHLGDLDNFITTQEPKDYTLREILNIENIIRQEPIS